MNKKVEITLSNDVYESITLAAENQDMEIEDYLVDCLIQQIDGKRRQEEKLLHYRDYIIKEIELLLNKVKGSSSNNETRKKSKVLVYSYKKYKQSLPKEIEKVLKYYKRKEWFNEDYFYFILDKKGVVGYMGLNPQKEALPFGEYLFVYSFYLAKSYHTMENLKYIAGFLQAIAKKENYYSVDIASNITNVEIKDLEAMGFIKFDTSENIIGIIANNEGVWKTSWDVTLEKISLSRLLDSNFTHSGRKIPLNFLLSQWKANEGGLDITLLNLQKDGREIQSISVEEKRKKEEKIINVYTILVEANLLFDVVSLREIYRSTIANVIMKNENDNVEISIPDELLESEKFLDIKSVEQVVWYRKIIL